MQARVLDGERGHLVTGHVPDTYLGLCPPCSKRIYTSRKTARRAGRRIGYGAVIGRLAAYRCPTTPDWFHLGHVNTADRDRVRRIRERRAS